MKRNLFVLAGLVGVLGVSCGAPPALPDGTGCRALPSADASVEWDGSYAGHIVQFNGQTCEGPAGLRRRALRVPFDGGGAGSSEAGNAACLDEAIPFLPADRILIIGPSATIWYRDLVNGNLGDATGIPNDVYACSVAYLDSQGIVTVWPEQ